MKRLGRTGRALLRFVGKAIFAVPAILFFFLNVRFVKLTHPERIGHLCIEPDCFIKEGLLGLRPEFNAIFLIPENRVANKQLLKIWGQKLFIISSPQSCFFLRPLGLFPAINYSVEQYAVAINKTAACSGILAQWAPRAPVLPAPLDLKNDGWAALKRLGVPEGVWFVCVHSREGGYSPADEHLHRYRNSEIENYGLAIDEIISRGGWCIRMGDGSSKPMKNKKGFVDYAHTSERSDSMDVFLCANCLFFLGNSSGLHLLSTIFGVPSALANLIPVSSCYPASPHDIGIPKNLRNRASGKYLAYSEILNSPIGNYRFAHQYESADIEVIENAPEEILELAIEMLDRHEGRVQYSPDDEDLQRRFRLLFRPGHYNYGAASRIGRDFLRRNSELIDA